MCELRTLKYLLNTSKGLVWVLVSVNELHGLPHRSTGKILKRIQECSRSDACMGFVQFSTVWIRKAFIKSNV